MSACYLLSSAVLAASMAIDLRAETCSPVYGDTQDYPLYCKWCALPHSGTVNAGNTYSQEAIQEAYFEL